MKCPHRLEPHQIQGLDFIHIFPVVQWLVKLAIATREEMGDYIRAFSESQFNRDHMTPEVGGSNHTIIVGGCVLIRWECGRSVTWSRNWFYRQWVDILSHCTKFFVARTLYHTHVFCRIQIFTLGRRKQWTHWRLSWWVGWGQWVEQMVKIVNNGSKVVLLLLVSWKQNSWWYIFQPTRVGVD